jgi:hypothetical protein
LGALRNPDYRLADIVVILKVAVQVQYGASRVLNLHAVLIHPALVDDNPHLGPTAFGHVVHGDVLGAGAGGLGQYGVAHAGR